MTPLNKLKQWIEANYHPIEIARILAKIEELLPEEREGYEWIPLTQRQPEEGRTVPFLCESSNDVYNNRPMYGRYHGFRFGYHEFSSPGNGWAASHWIDITFKPLPTPPLK